MSDSPFNRANYWDMLAGQHHDADQSIFRFPLAYCVEMPERELDDTNSQVFEIIARSCPRAGLGNPTLDPRTDEGRQEILGMLNMTTRFSIDALGNMDRLVALEASLVNVFKRLGLMHEIVGWQFPPDIRVVHPQAPKDYLERLDATDYLHCDPWRGEPMDLVNVVLYCEASDRASQLELYIIAPDELSPFETYTGDERDAEFLLKGRPPLEFRHRSGQVIIFDSYLPHRTRRLGDRVRISINFSMRRANPYAVIDERWNRDRQAWNKFWFVNEMQHTTFKARYEDELVRVAESESKPAVLARRAALTKHFGLKLRT